MQLLLKKMKRMSIRPQRLAEVLANTVVDSFGYIVIIVSFVIFVMKNGGIVLGDKSAHQAVIHLPQLGYFCLFFLFFSLPYAPRQLKLFLRLCRQYPVFTLGIFCVGVMVVHYNTLIHPYMLSDNRHYTFYIWNKLYGKYSIFRYLMVPVYMFGAYMIIFFLQNRSFPFQVLYLLCVSAIVVPQKLIEARYFILPFLIGRTQSVSVSWFQLITELVYNLLLNALVIYVFMTKTFMWDDIVEPQRIMW